MKYMLLALLSLVALESNANANTNEVFAPEAFAPGDTQCKCDYVNRGKWIFTTHLNLYRMGSNGVWYKERELAKWDRKVPKTCKTRLAEEEICKSTELVTY